MITINLSYKYDHPFWSKFYTTKSHLGMEPQWSWVWSQRNMGQYYLYLQVISRWMNVESENWRTSTIMLHITCIYPIR